MTGVQGDRLPIGEFSRRSRLPVSTLRYYHQRGLLEPVHVDPVSGYRYYNTDQLGPAELIGELRRAGVAPAVIAEITSGRVAVAAALQVERRRIEDEVRDRARAIATIDRLLARPPRAGGYRVGLETVRGGEVPAVRGAVKSGTARAGIMRMIASLRRRLRAQGLPGDGPYGAIFPLDLTADDIPTTVFAAAGAAGSRGRDDGGYLEGGCLGSALAVRLPARRAAVTELAGDHLFAAGYDALLGWVEANRLEAVPPVVEEYLVDGGQVQTRLSIGVVA
jgi:DNA-binding transcriptional MerR regulator